jgi:hypothetical protein
MTISISLMSSSDDLDRLSTIADGRGAVVRISRQELVNLIVDYGVMHTALSGSSTFKVTEPEHRERPRLKS